MTHAAEWGHWYDREGNPVYELPKLDGSGMRPVTIRDARKLGLVPGVSGVSGCAAKPALDRWKVRQGILAALTLPRKDGELDDNYIERVVKDSQEQARKAADKGSAIHAAIQGYYEDKEPSEEYRPFVEGAFNAVAEWAGLVMIEHWEPELSFAHPLGFGGKADLPCRSTIPGVLVDFKTKEFTEKDLIEGKQLVWDDHAIQLAAYRAGLKIPKAQCANCFVSTTEPGLAVVVPHEEKELERGWEMFKALLAYWKANRKYDSSFEERIAA